MSHNSSNFYTPNKLQIYKIFVTQIFNHSNFVDSFKINFDYQLKANNTYNSQLFTNAPKMLKFLDECSGLVSYNFITEIWHFEINKDKIKFIMFF